MEEKIILKQYYYWYYLSLCRWGWLDDQTSCCAAGQSSSRWSLQGVGL